MGAHIGGALVGTPVGAVPNTPVEPNKDKHSSGKPESASMVATDGHRLARAEITGMVDRLLDRLDGLAFASDTPPDLRVSNFIVGYESLPVTYTPSARVAR